MKSAKAAHRARRDSISKMIADAATGEQQKSEKLQVIELHKARRTEITVETHSVTRVTTGAAKIDAQQRQIDDHEQKLEFQANQIAQILSLLGAAILEQHNKE
jgi:hypothetical protein